MPTGQLLAQRLHHAQYPVRTQIYNDVRKSLFLTPGTSEARIEVYSNTSANVEHVNVEPENEQQVEFESNVQPQVGFLKLKTKEDLDRYGQENRSFQAFFIRQRNSYAALSITHDQFETLLSVNGVSPCFKDYVLYLGRRTRELEIAPTKSRWTPTQWNESTGKVNAFECMYGLRFVELNGRGTADEPTSRWSLRQSALYCAIEPGTARATWIFIAISGLAEHRVNEYVNGDLASDQLDPFEIHILLLDSAISNWRPYLVDLATEIEHHAERLLGASADDEGPISLANCGARQALMNLDDKMINATLVIRSTLDDCKAQLEFYRLAKGPSQQDEGLTYDWIQSALLEQIRELESLIMRIDAQRAQLQGITNLVSSFLDLSSGFALQNLAKQSSKENELMRKLNERMAIMTEKSTRDAVAVKVLTVLTLIYLPATVVSNFFSTSFVNSQSSATRSAHVVISDDWWIFLATSAPLTLLTLYVWVVWVGIQTDRKYPWWWYPRGRAGRDAAIPADTDVKYDEDA